VVSFKEKKSMLRHRTLFKLRDKSKSLKINIIRFSKVPGIRNLNKYSLFEGGKPGKSMLGESLYVGTCT